MILTADCSLLLKTRWRLSTWRKFSSKYSFTTLHQQSNGFSSIEKASSRAPLKVSESRDTRSLFSSVYPRSPLGFNFIPSYFKASSHFMRAYANLDNPIESFWRNKKKTFVSEVARPRRKKSVKKKRITSIVSAMCLHNCWLKSLRLFFW